MPLRFRKSVKIAGMRFNFGNKGLTSVSGGSKHFRKTVRRDGRTTTTVNLGGGMRYTQSAAPGQRKRRRWWLLWLA